MAIDTHMHINSKDTKDISEEIKRINDNQKIDKVINIGLNTSISKEILDFSNNNDKFYSTIGIHPLYIVEENIDDLIPLIDNSKVVAIGEIGLDKKESIDNQVEYLIKQIDIANNYHLPVIIHANNTNWEVLEIFKNIIRPLYGCVFHCFQPDEEILKELIKYEYYISFAGRVTYPNAKKSLIIAEKVPDSLYLVETDSPYISPVPYKEEKGKSEYIKYIIAKLAEIRKTTYENIEKQTTENAKSLFRKIN